MGVTASNILLGPAKLYLAAFGTAEPADSTVTPNGPTTPPPSPWADVGGTDGGVTLGVEGTLTALTVDQIIMDIGARVTELKVSVTTKLAEMSMANLNSALNSMTTTGSGSGFQTMDLNVTSAATQPKYAALIVDLWAPYLTSGGAALRRAIVRKVLCQPKVNMMADRKTQQSIDVVFNAYFVSDSVPPVHWVDQNA